MIAIRIAAASALVALTTLTPASAAAQEPFRFDGVACATPPVAHCPDANCNGDRIANPGNAVEMKTRRQYFLDYPCDLKPGEKITFVLSLHGAGAPNNWHRNYFPIMDYKDQYRLVIATPYSPTRVWSDVDDQYLQNIVEFVVDQIGKENIKAFWLAGHSQGGITSNRLLHTAFFSTRVDGWLSLSGGRLGGNPGRGNFSGMARGPAPAGGRASGGRASGAGAGALATPSGLPDGDFSFIYETGEREMDEKGLPTASAWAAKYSCGTRRMTETVVDAKAGYIYDTSRQNPPVPAWGLVARPGTARVYEYPGCKDGRVVADIVRLEKGHTEGLEPHITEKLVQLMLSAPGGKLQR